MLFGGKNIDLQTDTLESIAHLIYIEDKVSSENVSDMECNESPRSSTSMEVAEFSAQTPPNKNSEDVDETEESTTENEVVNLPAGA